MTKNMTKAEMMELIARMSEELAELKAAKATKAESVPAKKVSKTSTKSTAKSEKESAPAVPVLPVRKGKTVGFSGYVNHKVWVHNKPLMAELNGEYVRESKSISFPSAKSAEAFCKGFVPVLTDTQYEESKKVIDDGFKARAAEREKSAASKAKTPKESAPKKSGLIAKSAKAKKGATGEPVKKPEWRERAEKGEKPFSNYSTYKEYWHAVIGK